MLRKLAACCGDLARWARYQVQWRMRYSRMGCDADGGDWLSPAPSQDSAPCVS